jgi:hypothetical protein
MCQTMRNRKKLVKDALSLFLTLGITAISASATDALPLKENTQKGANAVPNCIRNTKQKPTPLKINRLVSNGNKQTDSTTDCYVCRYSRKENRCKVRYVPCYSGLVSTCDC